MFLKDVSYTHQGYIYLIKNSHILKYYYKYIFNFNILKFNLFLWWKGKWNFQLQLLQYSVSHDP